MRKFFKFGILLWFILCLLAHTASAVFIENGDTVTDTVTGLEWQKVSMGPMTWQAALSSCEDLTLNGSPDWRLPNNNELISLVDYSRQNPTIDPVFAATTQLSSYWSSSSCLRYSSFKYHVDFSKGLSTAASNTNSYYVRAVRGGQTGALSYLSTQVRPPDPEIPPEINGSGRKAVVLTHGWNSDVQAWAVDMANKICDGVGGTAAYSVFGYDNRLTPICSTTDWDVFVYDWSAMAATKEPFSAWGNAAERGTLLGKKLASKNYAHIHLLAHSAGSNLIDSAKKWLLGLPNKPFIHLTFFDAFDPLAQTKSRAFPLWLSVYGEGADWVDNYVDMRPLDALFRTTELDGTQLLMPSAYNVDVTKWDVRPAPVDAYNAALFRHAWPNVFYAQETFTPSMTYDLGYQLSLESGKSFPRSGRQKKTVCYLPVQIAGITPLGCNSVLPVPDLETNPDKIHAIGSIRAEVKQITNSVTGSVNSSSDPIKQLFLYWVFQTGSPVWSKMDLDVKEPVNVLTFDYEFLSAVGAEGYVSVFVDDNVVGHIDESKVVSSGLHASDRMYIGELAPGTHTLVVRVDPYTAVQSTVKLSNLKLVYVEKVIPTFPWPMFLPAITRGVK
jgi:pimeloyl-ACP methyl ester carboxylesterase